MNYFDLDHYSRKTIKHRWNICHGPIAAFTDNQHKIDHAIYRSYMYKKNSLLSSHMWSHVWNREALHHLHIVFVLLLINHVYDETIYFNCTYSFYLQYYMCLTVLRSCRLTFIPNTYIKLRKLIHSKNMLLMNWMGNQHMPLFSPHFNKETIPDNYNVTNTDVLKMYNFLGIS